MLARQLWVHLPLSCITFGRSGRRRPSLQGTIPTELTFINQAALGPGLVALALSLRPTVQCPRHAHCRPCDSCAAEIIARPLRRPFSNRAARSRVGNPRPVIRILDRRSDESLCGYRSALARKL